MSSSPSLSAIIRRGALWSIATTAMLKLANILTTAVIAHILDPRDFGVFAVALTAYGIVSTVGEFGLGLCLIRADLDIDALAPTMTTVAVTTNTIQAVAMVVFARPIAAALGSVAAAGPIKVLALAMFITGVFAVPGAQLIRDFKQNKIFLANFIGFLPSTAVLILLALSGGGAMAFAWSMVASTTISGFVMTASVPRHYRPGLSRSALTVLVRFGFPLAGANIVNYVLLNGDYVVVGHLAGAVALGAYVLAFNVASWPSSLLGFMLNNVSMPAFSRVKDDADRLNNAIARALRAISLIVMPMSALTIALARPLVMTLYGPKWTASVEPLSILASYGAISIICVLFANVLAGLGRARFILMVQLVWLLALVPGMVLGVHRDGIVGAAIAHLIVIGPIVLPIYLFGLRKVTNLATLARACLPALLAASIAALAAESIASQFTHPLVQLVAGLVVGGLTYAVIAVPCAITLLSQEQITKLRARRILRFYLAVASLVGLPAGSRPKHAGKSGGGRARQVPAHASGDQWQDGTHSQYPVATEAGVPSGLADGRAVASAATTPIPVVRPGTGHPVDASAATAPPMNGNGASADTRPDMFPMLRGGMPTDTPLRPRPYVGGQAASQREKDLARRSCLRLRCTCADPTICPAVSVAAETADQYADTGWQVPSAGRQQHRGPTLTSIAVASAATMPMSMVPGVLAYPFAAAATMPLPVVRADVAPPNPDTDARRSPGEEDHSDDGNGRVADQDPGW